MKHKVGFLRIVLILSYLLIPRLIVAQEELFQCGMPALSPAPESTSPAVHYGGRFITSTGTKNNGAALHKCQTIIVTVH